MSNTDYLKLKNEVTHWLEDTVGENLQYSVIDFYNWAFLQAGAYQNITRSPAVSGVFGGQRYRLSYVDDGRFSSERVWQGFRSNWVWETGVNFNPPPTSVSVFINNVEQPSTGYYVDYPRGRVVFQTAIPSGSTIEANFAHKTVNFVRAEEPWFRELMFDSYEVQRDDFTNSTQGGKWHQFAENRRQLPAVGVEIVGTNRYRPYQLGGGQWHYMDILYYIYSESQEERNKLRDIISNQNDHIIWLYDRGLMKSSPNWPLTLDYKGTTVDGFLTYPSLVNEETGFRFLNARFTNTTSENMETLNGRLYGAVVRTTAEMINPYG